MAPARSVAAGAPAVPRELPGFEIARVVGVEEGRIVVESQRLGAVPQAAESVIAPADVQPNDRVLVARLAGTSALVVVGRLFEPGAPARDIRINGRQISFEADAELVLRCAKATIRIRQDGLVAVNGERVTSRARRVNKILGGTVEIN